MALILGIETSSTNCSVALFENGNVISSKENDQGYTHSENLHLFIQSVIESADVKLKNLDAIIVGAGPGSFTGLRIGVATAKGLCYSLSIPLISMPSLLNLSVGAKEVLIPNDEINYCPLIDARRMEVYTAFYSSDLTELEGASAIEVDENSFSQHLERGKMCFFGDGMPKIKSFYEGHENALFLDDIQPSAIHMGKTAEEKFEAQSFEDTAYYEPFYLKGFHFTTPKKKV